MRRTNFGILLALLLSCHAVAQDDHASDQHDHESGAVSMVDMNGASMFLMNLASGTSENPVDWPMPMVMTHLGNWDTMFMGVGLLSDIQQSGPRGGDKLY